MRSKALFILLALVALAAGWREIQWRLRGASALLDPNDAKPP